MLCPRCASEIPDESRACPRCGTILAIDGPPLAATDVAKDLPQQERRLRAALIAVVVALAAAWFGLSLARRVNQPGASHAALPQTTLVRSLPVVSGPIPLRGRGIAAYEFEVPPGCRNVMLESRVEPSADASSPAEMVIFDEAGFAAWKARQPVRALYAGRVAPGILGVRLPSLPGRYHLLFTTGASTLPKVVAADVRLNCYR